MGRVQRACLQTKRSHVNMKPTRSMSSPDVSSEGTVQQKVVVNEVLCFISYQLRLLPLDAVVQLCEKFYKVDIVETAKKQVFQLCADPDCPADRYKSRKGVDKSRQHLKDIADTITRKNRQVDFPTFVAGDLSLLPPITFNDIDVSTLMVKVKTKAKCM